MYPQTVAERKIAQILERKYQSYEIEPTNDMPYTLNKPKQYRSEYRPIKYPVYAYNGEKYIRVVGINANDDSVLSNWKKVKNGQPYWVKVEPIEWLLDKSGWWVSRLSIISGVRFDSYSDYKGSFQDTIMYDYLNHYFAPEMMREIPKEKTNEPKSTLLKQTEDNQMDCTKQRANDELILDKWSQSELDAMKPSMKKKIDYLLEVDLERNFKNEDGRITSGGAKQHENSEIAQMVQPEKVSSNRRQLEIPQAEKTR